MSHLTFPLTFKNHESIISLVGLEGDFRMRIDITDITRSDKKEIKLCRNIDPLDLEHEISGITLTNDLETDLTIRNDKGTISLKGRVKGSYKTECGRCLREITGTFENDINEKFISKDKADEDTEEDCYTYEGQYIDISSPLIDNILLSFPLVMLCKEDCKGLCPVCGTDMNEKECSCQKQDINIRLEKLKDFFS